jgi:hypothetical protein
VEGKLSAIHAWPSATAVVPVTCTPTGLSGGTPCGVTPLPDSVRAKVTVGGTISSPTLAEAVGGTAGGGGLPLAVTLTDMLPALAIEDTARLSVLVAVPPPGAGDRAAGENEAVRFGLALADKLTWSAVVPRLVTLIVYVAVPPSPTEPVAGDAATARA